MAKTKWDQRELDRQMEADKKRYLIEAGEDTQNVLAENAPFITGLLSDSMTYHTSYGNKGSEELSKPIFKDTVRVGSSIIYAASVEERGKSAGWMSKQWDLIIGSRRLDKLKEKIFKI